MPAPLVPKDKISDLAKQVDPPMLKVLTLIKREGGVLMNRSDIDQATAAILKRLVELGAVDAGYARPTFDKPDQWVINGNGERLLTFDASKIEGTG